MSLSNSFLQQLNDLKIVENKRLDNFGPHEQPRYEGAAESQNEAPTTPHSAGSSYSDNVKKRRKKCYRCNPYENLSASKARKSLTF